MNTSYYEKYEALINNFDDKNIEKETVYNSFRLILSESFKKPTDFSSLSENEQDDFRIILENFGEAELVDIYVEFFGMLPPVHKGDWLWTTAAARLGNLGMLKRIHHYGFELDKMNEKSGSGLGKETPLESAIFDEDIVEYLLSIGCVPLVYNFGYMASHPERYQRSILKLIWDADPILNEKHVVEAFKIGNIEAVDWFKEIGAKFTDQELLFYACNNLWSKWVIDLISVKASFIPDNLTIKLPNKKKSPIEAAFSQNNCQCNQEKLCEFIEKLLPYFSEKLEKELIQPKLKRNEKCDHCSCKSTKESNLVYKLPCNHLAHENCMIMNCTTCPICSRPKYDLGVNSFFSRLFEC